MNSIRGPLSRNENRLIGHPFTDDDRISERGNTPNINICVLLIKAVSQNSQRIGNKASIWLTVPMSKVWSIPIVNHASLILAPYQWIQIDLFAFDAQEAYFSFLSQFQTNRGLQTLQRVCLRLPWLKSLPKVRWPLNAHEHHTMPQDCLRGNKWPQTAGCLQHEPFAEVPNALDLLFCWKLLKHKDKKSGFSNVLAQTQTIETNFLCADFWDIHPSCWNLILWDIKLVSCKVCQWCNKKDELES